MKNTKIKRALAILLAASLVLEGANTLPVYAQEETETKRVDEIQNVSEVECESEPEVSAVSVSNDSTDNAVEMVLGEEYELTLENDEIAYYKFIPEMDWKYKFYSTGSSDMVGELFDSDMNSVDENDDGGESRNFLISYTLSAGKVYYLKVSAYSGTASCIVNVKKEPLFVNDYEKNVTVKYREETTFVVNANSEVGELSYQWWQENGSPYTYLEIEGETGSSYKVKADENAREIYRCVVTDGTNTEDVYFYLTVDSGLVIADYEENVTAKYGKEAVFTVNATSEAETISYQWYYRGDEADDTGWNYYRKIEGATESNYKVKADENAKKEYKCIVTDGIEEENAYFYLTVDSGLEVAEYESNVAAKYGEEVTLAVNATSEAGTISYQWYYYDDTEWEYIEIEGATESSYTVIANGNTIGTYRCIVTDGIGTERIDFYLEEYSIVSSGSCGENATYTLDNAGNLTISGSGEITGGNYKSVKKVIIEEGITEIGEEAFSNCNGIRSISIPSSVTSIGWWSILYDCRNLSELIIDVNNPNYSLEENVVFNKNKSELFYCLPIKQGSYQVPEGVTSIDNYAFYKCSGLTSIEIPKGVTSIGQCVFEGCSGLTSINIPEGVTSIDSYAFYKCSGLTSIEIPKGVTSIGQWAFFGCSSLKSVILPSSLEEIEERAFGYIWDDDEYIILDGFSITGSIGSAAETYARKNGITFQADETRTVTKIEIASLPDRLEYGIDEEIKERGLVISATFSDGSSAEVSGGFTLTADTSKLGKTIVTVNYYGAETSYEIMVTSSAGLEYETLEDGSLKVTDYVGNARFVEIPEEVDGKKVTEIGEYVFYDKWKLEEIKIPQTIREKIYIMTDEDDDIICPNLKKIIGYTDTIAEDCAEEYGLQFESCGTKTITGISIETSAYELEYGFNEALNTNGLSLRIAFEDGTYGVRTRGFNVSTPDMSTKGEKTVTLTYKDFTTTYKINVSEGLEYRSLEDGTLMVSRYHGYAEQLEIPDKVNGIEVTRIDSYAFYKHSELKQVVIPETVNYIGYNAFYNCEQLVTITFPTTLSYVGGDAFTGTAWLENQRKESALVIAGKILIDGTAASGEVTIPDEVLAIANAAFSGCENITSVTIPEGMERIGADAFWACTGLKEIQIPGSVYEIGECAMGYVSVDYEEVWDSEEGDYVDKPIYTKQPGFTITGIPESAAQEYAQQNDFTFNAIEKEVEKIVIHTLPEKTVYGMYDELKTDGLSIQICFTDGTYVVRNTGFTVNDADMTTEGEKAVTVTYKTYTTEFLITVDATVAALPESVHYEYCNKTWTIYKKGAKALAITFSEYTYVDEDENEYICIYNSQDEEQGYYVNGELRGKTIVVNGDTAKIELRLSRGEDAGYGFKVTKVEETESTPELPEEESFLAVGETKNIKQETGATQTFDLWVEETGNYILRYANPTDKETKISVTVSNGNTSYTKRIKPFNGFTGSSENSAYNEANVPIAMETGQIYTITIEEVKTENTSGKTLNYQLYFGKQPTVKSIKVDNDAYENKAGGYNQWGLSGWAFEVTYSDGSVQHLHGPRGFHPETDTTKPYLPYDDYGNSFTFELKDKTQQMYTEDGLLIAGDYPVNITVSDGQVFEDILKVKGTVSGNDEEKPTSIEYSKLEDGTLEITKYVGSDTEVTIPAEIDGKSVTSIGDWAFSECSGLTSIEIPFGVTSIGDYAFYRCSSLTSIEIPGSVTDIGFHAFSECSSLTSIEIPGSMTFIGICAFYECRNLTSIKIPESVTIIGNLAFKGCSSLINIEVEETNIEYSSEEGVLFNKERTELIQYPNGKEGSYKIPESVTSIGEQAFYGCSNLTSIEISKNVANIGDMAFCGCSNLTGIEIPFGVEKIEYGAFLFCNSLKKIIIPSSVTVIGERAFELPSDEFAIYCEQNSVAHSYAVKYNIPYQFITSGDTGESKYIYKIIFDVNGGSGLSESSRDVPKESGIGTLPTVSRSGYIFKGWFTQKSGGTQVTADTIVSMDMTIYAQWEAVKQSIEKAVITLSTDSVAYDGTAKTPSVKSVIVNSKALTVGTDYTVSYKNNTNVGTGSVVITGIGNYTGTAIKTFSINAASLTKATVTLSTTKCTYNGKEQQPAIASVKLKVGNTTKTLKKDIDYTVSYKNNTNIGTATVTITGKGNYTGTVPKTFKITVKKGTTFTAGANKYKITSSSEVAFAGLKGTKTTKVTIPKTVKYGGKNFTVTAVADKALYKKTKVKSVTIGANVKTIGKEAFRGCSKLSSITIKSTKLKSVGKNALKGIKTTAKIKVPAKKLTVYKNLLKGKGQGKKVKITK